MFNTEIIPTFKKEKMAIIAPNAPLRFNHSKIKLLRVGRAAGTAPETTQKDMLFLQDA